MVTKVGYEGDPNDGLTAPVRFVSFLSVPATSCSDPNINLWRSKLTEARSVVESLALCSFDAPSSSTINYDQHYTHLRCYKALIRAIANRHLRVSLVFHQLFITRLVRYLAGRRYDVWRTYVLLCSAWITSSHGTRRYQPLLRSSAV